MCTRTGPLFCFFLTWYCWLAHRTRAQRILHRQGTIDLDEVLSANLASVQIDLFDAGQLHWRCPFIGDVTFAPPNDNYFHQETRHFSFRSRTFFGEQFPSFFFKFLNSNKAGKQESKNSVQGKPGINGSTLLKPTKAKTHAGDIHNLYNLYQFHSQQPSMPGQWPQVWHSSSSPSLEVAQQQQSQYIPQGMLVVGGGKWMAVRYERIVPKV